MRRISKGKLLRLLGYLRPYTREGSQLLVCMIFGAGLSLIDPLIIKVLIDNVLVEKNFGLLQWLFWGLVALIVFRAGLGFITSYLFSFIGHRVLFDIRNELFQHIERLHLGFHIETKTGEIMSRVHNDVGQLQNVITTTFVSLIVDLVTLIAILAIVFAMDWKLTLVSLAVCPLFIIIVAHFNPKIRRKSKETREVAADIMSFFQEIFSGIKVVQSFVREKYEARRHLTKSKKMINLGMELNVMGSFSSAISGIVAALGPALLLWFGGLQVIQGALTLGGLIAFYTYIGRLFGPISRLAQVHVTIQTAMASVDRIFEFLDIEPAIKDAPTAVSLATTSGKVAFEGVDFSYRPDRSILRNVSFEIERGETVAIVGQSGAGKTTIANLICRFFDPKMGSVKLDGLDLRKVRLKSLRRFVGLVSQETILFNDSIKENLKYGNPDATDQQIEEAAKMADIHNMIENLPEKYETLVGDSGVKLSGGERQRLSIARAILKDPAIMIFDEATSFLDSASENEIQRALEPFMKNRTTLIIAHRLSSVVHANRILVLKDGQITEQGTHAQLLQRKGMYKTLWDNQNKEVPLIVHLVGKLSSPRGEAAS